MQLELDHFFILTEDPKKTGDLLVSIGLDESFSRDHKGQGTSNRRFEFSNGMLEILYVRDRDECNNGPAKNLRFPERVDENGASPFGIILARKSDSKLDIPFAGWKYQPDYYDPPLAFHIGNNSEILKEPLCIYVPFIDPISRVEEAGEFKSIRNLELCLPVQDFSETLQSLRSVDRLQIKAGKEHLVVMTLSPGNSGESKDFRPDLPLVVMW